MSYETETRESIEFTNKTGLKLFGVLHRPVKVKKAPLVLMCHGLDGSKVSQYRMNVFIAEKLAQKGIATLRLDFRGAGDSQGHFSDIDIAGNVEDALQALDILIKDDQIDSERIGLIGRSLGAAVAIRSAIKAKKIKSMVLLCALFGQNGGFATKAEHYDMAEREVIQFIRQLTGCDPNHVLTQELLKLNLEKEVLSLGHIPLLHIHGEKDPVVSLDQADSYKRCRSHAEAPSKFIRLKNCTHEFIDPSERELTINEVVDWLANSL